MQKLILTALFVSIYLIPSGAQSLFFKCRQLGADFTNTSIEEVYEDPDGWLWFGTSDGLFLFDGLEFRLFSKADSTSKRVTAIYKDQQKVLWVGYEDGSIFYLQNNTLKIN